MKTLIVLTLAASTLTAGAAVALPGATDATRLAAPADIVLAQAQQRNRYNFNQNTQTPPQTQGQNGNTVGIQDNSPQRYNSCRQRPYYDSHGRRQVQTVCR